MRRLLKRMASFILIPVTRWYLRKPRDYSVGGVTITVMPGVFHPGLFSSTRFMIDYLVGCNLNAGRVLELGCGTGLISILAAKRGASVVSTDVSTVAVANARLNATRNNVPLEVIHSDLFEHIPAQIFSWILINPPYYRGAPKNEAEMAWYSGSDLEYFQRLFASLQRFTDRQSIVIMVLTQECPLEEIIRLASLNKLVFKKIKEKAVLFDGTDFLFQVMPAV